MLDIAWIAGIFEGEGHCRYQGTPAVLITQKDPWVLEKIVAKFGGSIRQRATGYYDWALYGKGAAGLLLTIYSFLSPRRREQAKKTVQTYWSAPGRGRKMLVNANGR